MKNIIKPLTVLTIRILRKDSLLVDFFRILIPACNTTTFPSGIGIIGKVSISTEFGLKNKYSKSEIYSEESLKLTSIDRDLPAFVIAYFVGGRVAI